MAVSTEHSRPMTLQASLAAAGEGRVLESGAPGEGGQVVGNHEESGHFDAAEASDGEKRRAFHLDRQHAVPLMAGHLVAGLAENGIRRPDGPRASANPFGRAGLGHLAHQRLGRAGGGSPGRIVRGRPLVDDGRGRDHQIADARTGETAPHQPIKTIVRAPQAMRVSATMAA